MVPGYAEASMYVRSYNRTELDGVVARVRKVLQGAAMMTETEVEIIEEKSLDNKIPVLLFALKDPQNIIRAVMGEKIGTIVKG